ncbi:MAG TPA: hypothetical protein VFN42_14790 [Acetobacteraceae bacterium]|nr:hypothetical protein [Acetobacteraceae bacterium]
MDDIRTEHDSSLTERKPEPAADNTVPPERRKVGPESEVRGGPEAPEERE